MNFVISDKDEAREYFYSLRQKFIDWNYTPFESAQFKGIEEEINNLLTAKGHEKSI
jgi:V/A-type H+-transporting ATPase subunit A